MGWSRAKTADVGLVASSGFLPAVFPGGSSAEAEPGMDGGLRPFPEEVLRSR
jgi:hypothetical protein